VRAWCSASIVLIVMKRLAPESSERPTKRAKSAKPASYDGRAPVRMPLWQYVPGAIDAERSDALYQSLTQQVRDICSVEGVQPIHIFGKEHQQRRLIAYFAVKQEGDKQKAFTYSGIRPTVHEWTPELAELAKLASQLASKATGKTHVFPRALLNWYEHGGKRVDAHRDKDAMNGVIVSFSLAPTVNGRMRTGSERPFVIYDAPTTAKTCRQVARVTLRHRSAFLMLPGMQQKCKHAFPEDPVCSRARRAFVPTATRTAEDAAEEAGRLHAPGPRLNITFREVL